MVDGVVFKQICTLHYVISLYHNTSFFPLFIAVHTASFFIFYFNYFLLVIARYASDHFYTVDWSPVTN